MLWLVSLGELRGEIGEVREGEFARVGAVADAEEAEIAAYEVAESMLAVGCEVRTAVCTSIARDSADSQDILVGV